VTPRISILATIPEDFERATFLPATRPQPITPRQRGSCETRPRLPATLTHARVTEGVVFRPSRGSRRDSARIPFCGEPSFAIRARSPRLGSNPCTPSSFAFDRMERHQRPRGSHRGSARIPLADQSQSKFVIPVSFLTVRTFIGHLVPQSLTTSSISHARISTETRFAETLGVVLERSSDLDARRVHGFSTQPSRPARRRHDDRAGVCNAGDGAGRSSCSTC